MDDGSDEYAARTRVQLNVAFHRLLGIGEPCQTACTHVIDGEWTALGAANVLSRHSHNPTARAADIGDRATHSQRSAVPGDRL